MILTWLPGKDDSEHPLAMLQSNEPRTRTMAGALLPAHPAMAVTAAAARTAIAGLPIAFPFPLSVQWTRGKT